MDEQLQCPECKSFKVQESNMARGTYVGGMLGVLLIPLHWNPIIGFLSIGVMLLGLLSMMVTAQWKGIKRVGIFMEILALLLFVPFGFNFVTVSILLLGLLLNLIGRALQNKTSQRKYKCTDCGYQCKKNDLILKHDNSTSVP